MTTVAVTPSITDEQKVARRRPTMRLVKHLQEKYQLLTDSWIKKNDDLTEALNERDTARDERDAANQEAADDCAKHLLTEHELRGDLRRLRDAFNELEKQHTLLRVVNQINFDKAMRREDVATALVYCLVRVTGEDPNGMMFRLVEAVEQIGIPPEVLSESCAPLKRGYNAQVDRVVDIAVNTAEALAP